MNNNNTLSSADSGFRTAVVSAQPPEERKKVIRSRNINQIPDDILSNAHLNAVIRASLPENYNFEVHKIIWRVRESKAKRVGLQFPEGLFIFSIPLKKIIESFSDAEVIVFGDVTYGACCVDDFTAVALGVDFLVHFAHSCLVPINQMTPGVKVLYVFVDIKFDIWHLLETIKKNVPVDKKIALSSTIQFVSSIHSVKRELESKGYKEIVIPQSRPLSKGEVLGCTASKLDPSIETVIFVADGRFHLEAMMIANPQKTFLRYNPYNKEMTRESYAFDKMIEARSRAVITAKEVLKNGGKIGLLLGSLGRQGSRAVFDRLRDKITKSHPSCQIVNIVIPEISPKTLNAFGDSIDLWVQVACPRLSIDWGEGFVPTNKPLLTPFELNVALDSVPKEINFLSTETKEYPMDFYASDSKGDWTPSHKCNPECQCLADGTR